jgi:DNA-binding transcriptional regulator YiaG
LLSVGATLFGGALIDEGTRVVDRFDYRAVINGTSLTSVHVEGPVIPFLAPTRMARIRSLAPLSLREWATVFGVSHSAIKQWVDGDEPNREKLDRVLGAISEAGAHHPDLAVWLTARVPGTDLRPIDLLREDRWRAFRGAIRTRSAPVVDLAPDELVRRRRAQVSWAVPEPLTVADEA